VNARLVRLAEHSDASEILSVLRAAFPDLAFHEAWWRWFTAGCTRSYVLADGASIVGMFSVMEYPSARVCGHRLRAGLAANLCLLPGYQRRSRGGRSLFSDLSRAVTEAERNAGLDLILVVPNQNSLGRLLELGWRPWAELVTWEKRELALSSGIPPAQAVLSEELAEDLASKPSSSHDLVIGRSLPFLSWRLLDRPEAEYELGRAGAARNALVLKRYVEPRSGEVRMHLMDFGSARPEELSDVLSYAESRAASVGAQLVNFWLAAGHGFEAVAKARGFSAVNRRPLLGLPLNAAVPSPEGAHCTFTFTDCDVY
jgi:hypothetical protein